MSALKLEAKKREKTGKKVKDLLEKNLLPGVIYGHKIENKNIEVKRAAFEKVYKAGGESTLIDLQVDDEKPVKAIIKETQMDVSGEKFIHFDLNQVNMDEKLTTEIALKFTGEAPAVKTLGGMVITYIDSVAAECLPDDLVHEIEVDISSLDGFDRAIHIKDLKVPKGIKLLNEENDLVVIIEEPREEKVEKKEEAVAGAEAAPAAEKAEGEKKEEKKKDDKK
ncbi:MAG: 50S ribosomal protein L25 [bacterium]